MEQKLKKGRGSRTKQKERRGNQIKRKKRRGTKLKERKGNKIIVEKSVREIKRFCQT